MTAERPTPFELDQLVAGELSPAESARVRAAAEADPELARYLEARRAEQADLMARLPPDLFSARAAESALRAAPPAGRPLARFWPRAALLTGLAAAAVLFLIFWPRVEQTPPDVLWMGDGVAVRLHVLRGDQVLVGETPRVGDRVRFEVVLPPQHAAHAAVLAVEGDRVTPVLPADGPALPVLENAILPGSVDLSPGGGVVEILLVVRPEPFDVASLTTEVAEAVHTGQAPLDGLVTRFVVDLGP